ELAAEICAVVAFSAIQNDDKVGLLLFSDRIELFVPPKKGRKHVLRLIRDLFAHEQQSTGTKISVALDHIVHVLRRRSIVMLLSDFMDDGFEPALRAVSRRHDTIAVHLMDPVEQELPDVGLMEVTDAETGQRVLIDTSSPQVRDHYREQARSRELTIDRMLRRLKVDKIPIITDEGYVDPLIRFFRNRNRMIRA
ncbi:MAG: VWA domain-containing protein, partial [Bacteroidetes bacterium]|nr:VWA domain-containing protein [Bacteroidota bacterium]